MPWVPSRVDADDDSGGGIMRRAFRRFRAAYGGREGPEGQSLVTGRPAVEACMHVLWPPLQAIRPDMVPSPCSCSVGRRSASVLVRAAREVRVPSHNSAEARMPRPQEMGHPVRGSLSDGLSVVLPSGRA